MTFDEFRNVMESVYPRTRNIDAATKKINEHYIKEHSQYMIPPQIYEGVIRQMVRHVANALEEQDR
jgi:hypothetical protein